MRPSEARYLFATHFMWRVLVIFNRLLEGIQIEDIEDRAEDFEEEFDDIGWWLIDQGGKFRIIIDGERESVMRITSPKKQIVAGWGGAIESLSDSVPLDEPARSFYLLYLACRWLSAILDELESVIARLAPAYQQSYASIQPLCAKLRVWLRRQQDEILGARLPVDKRTALERAGARIEGELTAQWRDVVMEYAAEYSE